jgi:NAD+ kinase
MPNSAIKRVGIVVKPRQQDALKTVCEVVSWLSERAVTVIGAPDIERERIREETGCVVEVVEGDELAANVDLMLVLGGDGTMIATSRMVRDTEVPVLGVNYGGLGYLAEFRVAELYAALTTILEGDYAIENA